MEDVEMFFLEKSKKVDPDFRKLYDEITGHNPIKFKTSELLI